MGKRSHSDVDMENIEDYIANKVKKMSRKLLRAHRRKRRRDSSSSESSSSAESSSSSGAGSRDPSPSQEPLSNEDVPRHVRGNAAPAPPATPPGQQLRSAGTEPIPGPSNAPEPRPPARAPAESQPSARATDEPQPPVCPAAEQQPPAHAPAEPQPSTSAASEPQLSSSVTLETLPSPSEPNEPPLDEDLLRILGEDPSLVKRYGGPIQPDLAIRLQHIVTTGLNKEARKELMEKYLPPSNCTLLDAPMLNPEVRAAINETILKRDKAIENKQKQLCSAAACIATAMTSLINNKDTTVMQLLMDASKLICDSQFSDSVTRRNFILFNLKKDLKDQLQSSKIDKMLFGEDLPAAIKTAKAISKSGADLKSIKKPPKNPKTTQSNLNWRGPPQVQARQKGNQRTRDLPAFKTRQDNSSKKSSRPATRNSRR